MAGKNDNKADDRASGHKQKGSETGTPGWADGLRKLYDSVVDEPLPDSFKELLSRLDDQS